MRSKRWYFLSQRSARNVTVRVHFTRNPDGDISNRDICSIRLLRDCVPHSKGKRLLHFGYCEQLIVIIIRAHIEREKKVSRHSLSRILKIHAREKTIHSAERLIFDILKSLFKSFEFSEICPVICNSLKNFKVCNICYKIYTSANIKYLEIVWSHSETIATRTTLRRERQINSSGEEDNS